MKTKFVAGLALLFVRRRSLLRPMAAGPAISLTAMCGAKGANEKHADCAAKCVKEHGGKVCVRQ